MRPVWQRKSSDWLKFVACKCFDWACSRTEWKLICTRNLIVHAEELHDLVRQYERNGYFDELISLLEAGLGLERAHMVGLLNLMDRNFTHKCTRACSLSLALHCPNIAQSVSWSTSSSSGEESTFQRVRLKWLKREILLDVSNNWAVIRACEQAHLWPELIFLYCQ